MKIAYVSHYGRPCYEYEWFSKIPCNTIKFIDVDFSKYPNKPPNNVEYCSVNYKENIFFKNRFGSTAKMITYANYEKYLTDVDAVIVLEVFSSLSKQFVRYCKQKGIHVSVLVYELIPRHPLHYLPTHILNRKYTTKNADKFICVSKKAQECIKHLGVDNTKSVVIYPGIDLEIFKKKATTKKVNGLMFVGGLKLHKGIDIAVNTIRKLHQNNIKSSLTVAGKGPYSDIVTSSSNSKIINYLGVVENKNLPNELSKNDIFLLPCRDMYKFGLKITSEQFGFSFVEAMACGLAIITTDCGAIPEIVTDNNIVCTQGDNEMIYKAVRDLISNPERLKKIQQRNISIVKTKYDITRQAKKILIELS